MTSRFTTGAAKKFATVKKNENQHANRQFQLRHKICTVWCKSQNIRKRHVLFVQINLEMNIIIEFDVSVTVHHIYEGWNFNSGNYLFTTDTK